MRPLLFVSLLLAAITPAQDARPVTVTGELSIVFWVDDFDAAVTFWKRVLGAETVYLLKSVGFGELRTPIHGVKIGIARSARKNTGKPGNAVVPTFSVSDLDATLASLKDLGIEPARPVVEMPGLCRLASIHDPAGNEVQFVESLRKPTSPWTKVAFLTGCWRQTTGETTHEEVWTPVHGNSMYGQNRVLRGGKMRFFELLRIDRRDDDLIYVAMPAARSVTSFKLTACTATSVTFTNPEHDFPKRIKYWLDDDGDLRAVVDDGTDASKNKQEFRLQRVE